MRDQTEGFLGVKGSPKIGAKLKRAREYLGLKAVSVAELAGLSSAYTLYGYESDRREPNFASLLRLCDTLRVTPNELFEYQEFDRHLFRDVIVAVDAFMESHSRKIDAEKRAELYIAVYDALSSEPDKLRDENGKIDLTQLMALMRLAL
ncbi:helix-turn-helix domain-containing protein [Thalassospira marina]|uniref:HTH cro/C1-type domain-containing protein n=1 Tax=Thalassospira marina TaxID=2048283 RepID=A0A2N3KWX0_9PROT|nr:helix-turn-helix domain-containing protein [Thalassospira marina]PKR55069.1 hypothetical protein COO20_06690 [Thalassospira marina]|tara:strand:- start:68624 stop:69070 length:447 start_codon:yes stop_codon:yes gene_type:complete